VGLLTSNLIAGVGDAARRRVHFGARLLSGVSIMETHLRPRESRSEDAYLQVSFRAQVASCLRAGLTL